jgi:hypothetical protein
MALTSALAALPGGRVECYPPRHCAVYYAYSVKAVYAGEPTRGVARGPRSSCLVAELERP